MNKRKCRRCGHYDCFGFDWCICETCNNEADQNKTLSMKEVNEAATVVIARKRTPTITHALLEFVSMLQRVSLKNEAKRRGRK